MTLQAKAADWRVTLNEIRETPASLVGFGTRSGLPVVLKVTKQAGDESHAGEVLRAFAGDGVARVFESEIGAVLLERLQPGEQLVNLVKRGDDEEATRILAQVMLKLAHHEAPPQCPTVLDWGLGFERYLSSGNDQIPRDLVQEARDLYGRLAHSQRRTMLLHGDLHHYNVLFDRDRGWVVIDPKGVSGELEFEVGAILRNPVEKPEVFSDPATINRRIEILTNSLPLDRRRTIGWSFAQAVLSAIWNVEDGDPVASSHGSVLLARSIKELFELKV